MFLVIFMMLSIVGFAADEDAMAPVCAARSTFEVDSSLFAEVLQLRDAAVNLKFLVHDVRRGHKQGGLTIIIENADSATVSVLGEPSLLANKDGCGTITLEAEGQLWKKLSSRPQESIHAKKCFFGLAGLGAFGVLLSTGALSYLLAQAGGTALYYAFYAYSYLS